MCRTAKASRSFHDPSTIQHVLRYRNTTAVVDLAYLEPIFTVPSLYESLRGIRA